jgi:iron complex transport system substrate-binding protein
MPALALLLAARAASLNLCTDEYLLLLAKPQEIASVSYLSQDARESPLWRNARAHHVNFGTIEQVIRKRPNILLTMGGGGRASGLIAARMNMREVDLTPPSSLDDVAANLRVVAGALGHPDRATAWLLRLDRLRRTQPQTAKDAIFLGGGGRTFQPGSPGILWLRLAGLQQRSLPGGRASLETLLMRPPTVLVESNYRRAQISSETGWLNHPVVRRIHARRLTADGRAWTCMGPLMIVETERLRKALK